MIRRRKLCEKPVNYIFESLRGESQGRGQSKASLEIHLVPNARSRLKAALMSARCVKA